MFNNKLLFKDLGFISYQDAYDFQVKLFETGILNKKTGNPVQHTILFCEHPHVYTTGKSGDDNNLLVDDAFLSSNNVTYCKTDRGGDITYHGPGQIVVYPIIDLDFFKIGTKDYIYRLEYIIIELMDRFGLKGSISKGNIGVWLDVGTENERKICSIGVKVSRGVTMHGLALNVNTDLSYFKHIHPCGFTDKKVTSLLKETGLRFNIDELKVILKQLFEKYFLIE